jgi:hypothetical protein
MISEIRLAKDLSDEMRQELIQFSIRTMGYDHPQAVLTLFTESRDLFKDGHQGIYNYSVSLALAKWAKDDPMAALEWVKQNGEKYPDLVTEKEKIGMISGAAGKDRKLAFKLIGELGVEDSSHVAARILRSAENGEARTAALAAMREHVATLQDEGVRSQVIGELDEMAAGIAKDGFEVGSKWITDAKLSEKELDAVFSGLTYNLKSNETGQWVEWVGASFPEKKSREHIDEIVINWTEKDYAAAGKWLATAPAGPTKNNAIRSYVDALSRYEPEAAVQWALTLPPDKDREATFKKIYRNWPKKDDASKAAAEAFKEQHGIK